MPSLTLKIGAVEVAYEGEQQFIENGLSSFVAEMIKTATKVAPAVPAGDNGQVGSNAVAFGHTTSLIAQIISAKTGSELALAAIAHMTLVQSKETVTRSEILTEMKGAASFYQDSYSGNLTKMLATLVKTKKINPISRHTYALSAAQRKEFEEKLKTD